MNDLDSKDFSSMDSRFQAMGKELRQHREEASPEVKVQEYIQMLRQKEEKKTIQHTGFFTQLDWNFWGWVGGVAVFLLFLWPTFRPFQKEVFQPKPVLVLKKKALSEKKIVAMVLDSSSEEEESAVDGFQELADSIGVEELISVSSTASSIQFVDVLFQKNVDFP